MMTHEELRWAEAFAMVREHRNQVVSVMEGQVAELTATGDRAGLLRIQAIAVRIDQLCRPEATGQRRLS